MAYAQTQFIAYLIDTVPAMGPGRSQTYLGLEDTALDIEARCELMLRAMRASQAALPTSSPPPAAGTVLKVFIAPEFFFRGATGTYQMNDVHAAIERLRALVATADWDDWVFGFGTIVGTAAPANGSAPPDIFNFALIQEGGAATSGPNGARVIVKKLVSGSHLSGANANPGAVLPGELPNSPPRPDRKTQQIASDGGGIFAMREITWAADIGRDHLQDRLVRLRYPGEQQVQVQLVLSAAAVAPSDIVAMDGGYVFHVDGAGHGTDLRQVGGNALLPVAIADVDGSPIELESTSPVQTHAVSALFPSGPGQILFFAPQAIPAARAIGGSRVSLTWSASASYRFGFDILYDEHKDYKAVVMRPRRTKTDVFQGNDYFLPLTMKAMDPQGLPLAVSAKVQAGRSGLNCAVWCSIAVPGFKFEGVAFEFSTRVDGPAPETVW